MANPQELDYGAVTAHNPGLLQQLQEYLQLKPGRTPNTVQRGADMLRGLTNSVVPGVAVNSQFQPDLYNPFTGRGRDPELSLQSDSPAIEGVSNMGQAMASAGGSGLVKSGAAQMAKRGTEGAETLFKNKTWDAIPDVIKNDPQFVAEAIAKFNTANKGKAIGRGISEVPTIVDKIPSGAKAVGGKGAQLLNGLVKGATNMAKSGVSKFAENPLLAKAAMSPVVAGANLVNDAKGQVQAEDQQQGDEAAFNSPAVTVVPTTWSDEGAQFTGTEPTKPSAGEQLQAILSGNKGLTPYKRPEAHGFGKILSAIANTFDSRGQEEQDQLAAGRDYQNQITQRGTLDPLTSAKLQEFMAEQQSGRQRETAAQDDTRKFGQVYAPAIKQPVLENIQHLPQGSIDPEMLRTMATQKKEDPMMQLMMSLIMGQMSGAAPQVGPQQQQKLNIPARK